MSTHNTDPATPRPNVDVVRQIYDAFKERDVAKLLSLFAPEIQIRQSSEIPWGGTFDGHDGAARFFAGLTQAITSAVTCERYIDAGDSVVAIGRTAGTVNATGAHFDVQVAHVWELRDGRAVRVTFCIDNPTMLASLSRSDAT